MSRPPDEAAITKAREIVYEIVRSWAVGPNEHEQLLEVLRLLGDPRHGECFHGGSLRFNQEHQTYDCSECGAILPAGDRPGGEG